MTSSQHRAHHSTPAMSPRRLGSPDRVERVFRDLVGDIGASEIPGWRSVIWSHVVSHAGDVAIVASTAVFVLGMGEIGLALMHLR